jgi:1-acyl-sn-glycerol-3-phosphate acyltransferase
VNPAVPNDVAARLLALLQSFARDSGVALPAASIGLDSRLEADLGLDSLGRAELVARVERVFSIRLPDEALLAATGRDLLALCGSAGPAQTPEPGTGPALGASGPGAWGAPADAASLTEVLQWHLERHPSRVHILAYGADDRAQPITYADLAGGAARVAAGLKRAGLAEGATVALMLPTGPDYFFCFFGVLVAGGIPVPIYPPARPAQVEDHLRRHARILDNAGAAFLITIPEARTVARLLKAQVPSLKGVLTPGAFAGEGPAAGLGPRPADAIALLQYTSGSTGDPKGVILTHADLLANIRAMGEAVAVGPDDCFVSWLPLYHDMGLIGAWLGSLYFGMPLVSLSPLAFLARPLRWLKAIHDHRGTLSAAPNFAYELCLKRIGDEDLTGLDLGCWRRAFNGAEPVSADTLRRFGERFAACGLRGDALTPVYGLAEAAVGLAFPPLGRGPRIDCVDRMRFAESGYALAVPCGDPQALPVVGCGHPLPGYRVRVVDAAGKALPERHEGLLQFQGPSATQGYYRNPQATARLIRDGWHDTGDRGYLAGGEIHVTGRVKDMIIRGGRNLYPYEVEQAVGELSGIRRGCVAAFAAADPATGSERLVLVAETRQRDPTRRAGLERAVRERAADILALPPDEVVLAPPGAVLKTSSGKLRRAATRDRYLAGKILGGPAPPLWQLVRVGTAGLAATAVRGVRRVPAWLYAAYAWALFGAIAPWAWLGVLLLPRLEWRWALVRGGVRLLRWLALVPLDVSGRERIPAPGSAFVVASNHQSYLDAMVLVEALGRPVAFVAKQELAGNPLARVALVRLGTHFVERFDVQRGAGDWARLAGALGPGEVLGFFPEGTFRDQPGLLPFRMGAFLAAAGAGTPLLPIALRGTRDLMCGSRFFPRRGRVLVMIGEPLRPAGQGWEAAVRLRGQARAFISAHCGEPDAGG